VFSAICSACSGVSGASESRSVALRFGFRFMLSSVCPP
jgi:hypothetical protein